MSDTMKKSAVFLTTVPSNNTPHSEYVPWVLADAGWEVTVVAPNEREGLVRCTLSPKWTWRDLRFGAGTGHILSELLILWELLRARFGGSSVIVIHSQGLGWRAPFFFLGPLLGKRLVYHTPDYYDPITYPVRSWLEGCLARKCDLFLSTEYHRAYILRAQHRLNCPVVVSPPNLAAQWPIPARSERTRSQMDGGVKDAFVLRLNSRFGPLRMVAQVMEALSLLPPRFRLVMTGEERGWNPQANELACRLGIRDRVVMLPPMDYADVLAYTSNADAGVLLYDNNDLGNYFTSPGRLTDYLACGLPVLASRFAGLESVVCRYGIGECVDAWDPKSIAAGIARLANGVESGLFDRGKIRSSFERHFAYERWAPEVVAAFERLLSSKQKMKQSPPPQYWFPGAAEG